jgi:hypothetical protein
MGLSTRECVIRSKVSASKAEKICSTSFEILRFDSKVARRLLPTFVVVQTESA